MRSATSGPTRRFRKTQLRSLSIRSRTSAAGMSRADASSADTRPGSSIEGGVTKTDCTSTDVASSSPLRSVISPRSAGSVSSWESCMRAAFASQSRSSSCHHTRRPPISVATSVTMMRRTKARARLSVLASMLVSVRRPSFGRGLGQSAGWLADGAKVTAPSSSGTSPSSLLARRVISDGDRAWPISQISCC